METRLWIAAAVLFAATLLLGATIAFREPSAVDRAGFAFRGVAVPAAFLFTLLGRWQPLLAMGVIAVGVGMTVRQDLRPVLVVLGTQVASQAATSLLKLGYRRARPYEFIGRKELEHSYPSGHATTAMVFFLGFAILTCFAPFPHVVSAVLVGALVACALGIPWSRLALGAHYVTDVVGGALFGCAWLCALIAVLERAPAHVTP